MERYYQNLLANDIEVNDDQEHNKVLSGNEKMQQNGKRFDSSDKWKKQIEKVIRCMASIFLICRCYFF